MNCSTVGKTASTISATGIDIIACFFSLVTWGMAQANQKLCEDISQLEYGVSITDACIGWQETVDLLGWAHDELGTAKPAAVR